MRWKRKKRSLKTRRFRLRAIVLLLVTLAAILAAPHAKRRFHHWSVERRVDRAGAALAKADYKHALLDARSALDASPLNAEAMRIIAQSLEALDRPESIPWRRQLDALGHGTTENTLAWALGALKAGDAATAASVLATLDPSEQTSATFHDIAAKIALAGRDGTGAESHWAEAVRLDPGREKYQLSLTKVQMKSRQAGVRRAALDTLDRLSAKPGQRAEILRLLIEDALNSADPARAAELAEKLVATAESTFDDRLTRLTTLKALGTTEPASELLQLKNEATKKPRDLYQLLAWMNRNGLAQMVSEWAPGLPQDLAAQPPICVAIAEAYSIGTDWKKLKETIAGTSWGNHEYLRSAFQALALKKLEDDEASASAWNAAVAEGMESPEAMESLARIALNWGWEEQAEAVLWSLAQSDRCPRWALDALWRTSLRRGESSAVYDLAKLLANAAPKDLAHRNNVVLLGLLTHGKENAIHTMAESLYNENSGNADIAATYGLSLYQRGRLDKALAVMASLNPEQLRKPGVARYFCIFLNAAKDPKAREYFDIGIKGPLLPEEKALMVARTW